MVKAIAFDVGGVLQIGDYSDKPVRNHRCLGVHDYIARHLNIDVDDWFDAIDTSYAKAIEGKISKNKAIAIIAGNLKVSPTKLYKILVKAYRSHFKRNNALYNIVKKLRKNKYKTIILSDQWYPSEEALIPNKDKKFFDVVIVSCEVGFRKPNPKIYKLALKKARVSPHELVFIDNREWNTRPARKMGIKTVIFKSNKQTIKELKKLGVKI
jgi:epoxide hydrolase-like predicted phosphatase